MEQNDLTEAELEYYREVWGFDPVHDKILVDSKDSEMISNRIVYCYETMIELVNDLELTATNVQIFARVDVDQHNQSHNTLIFKRGKQEGHINCVHTVVYTGSPVEIAGMTDEELDNLSQAPDRTPVQLSPWEHFAALKSFAQGLAEIGFLQICLPPRPIKIREVERDSLGDTGINRGFAVQIIIALRGLVPEIIKPRLYELVGDLLDKVSPKWLIDRLSNLDENLGIYEVFSDPVFIASLDLATLTKLLKNYLYARQHPIFDMDEDKFSISLLTLTPELIEPLDVTDKRTLLLLLVNEYPLNQGHNLQNVGIKLFQDLIDRGDTEIICSPNLRNILEALKYFFYVGSPWNMSERLIEIFKKIAPETLEQLLASIFRDWAPESDTRLGILPFQIIYFFLEMAPNQENYHRILTQVVEEAPPSWFDKIWRYLPHHSGQKYESNDDEEYND